ncbi:MAG TPA: PepSY-associated TM helix domain-containing protein [Sediminibacterium sp.]|nr:PepSY-associated TM helix domain-containing protein [Sediminibacterium sp.]HQS56346.1 PepSY-associated TM helix domain-containing protein [Sediminibacterium sp.]
MGSINQKKSAAGIKWNRKFAEVSRWLHIYVSMISFAIVLFFSVTGVTLNHPDYFAGEMKETHEKGQMDTAWVKVSDTVKIAKLEMVELLRKQHGIKAPVTEFRIEEEQCAISFRGPGYAADAFVNRTDGNYEITLLKAGAIGVLNDLHKGRDSGAKWAILIDVSAILMILISLTGIILLLYIKRKRISGIVWALIGLALAYLVYQIWV